MVDGRDTPVDAEGQGFWLGPTLFDKVTPTMSIYTDEIFGPVLSVVRVPTYDAALELVREATATAADISSSVTEWVIEPTQPGQSGLPSVFIPTDVEVVPRVRNASSAQRRPRENSAKRGAENLSLYGDRNLADRENASPRLFLAKLP